MISKLYLWLRTVAPKLSYASYIMNVMPIHLLLFDISVSSLMHFLSP